MSRRPLHSRLLRAAAGAAVAGWCLWGSAALWYQARWPLLWIGLWLLPHLALLAALAGRLPRRVRRRLALAVMFAGLALAGWWHGLQPSQDRDWAPDVARLLAADVDGRTVTLHNVRNFDWNADGTPMPHWDTRQYDLDRLQSADLLLSYWMGPAIAHTLVSFGFDDGSRVVFSLEIRRERDESFSALGGFFRKFEAVLIAADERDIVRVRSNRRGEQVHLYRLAIPPEQLRTLFLAYVDEAHALQAAPRFYNTLVSNCTTIVFKIARHVAPGLPLDIRLLLSGYFAGYVHAQGGLAGDADFNELQRRGNITAHAWAAEHDPDFSRAIRRGIPGIPDSETR